MEATQNDRIDANSRKAGDRMTLMVQGVEYAFRWIPAGSFLMGSPKSENGRQIGEVQHKVNISRGFWMLESPVTQGMWTAVMSSNPSYFKSPDRFSVETVLCPVENVSWDDCQGYVQKLNGLGVCPDGFAFSLPTEAEWEYACRAGTASPFWFGNALNGDQANCDGKSPYGVVKYDPLSLKKAEPGKYLMKTTEVGEYPANAWGLYDVHGNVYEWTLDLYGSYPTGEVTDPRGSEYGARRIIRGGSWVSDAVYCRSARRDWESPKVRAKTIGARLVLRPQD